MFVCVCKCVLVHMEATGQPLPLLSFPDVIHFVFFFFLKKKKSLTGLKFTSKARMTDQ